MNLRIRFARLLLSAGKFLQTLPVAVLRPSDMSEWARVRYDRHSAAWNTQNDPDAGLTKDEMTLWEHVPTREDKLLILGGGGGREAIFFARQGWQVTAFDLSAGMLAEARAAMQARGSRTRNGARRPGDVRCAAGIVRWRVDFDVFVLARAGSRAPHRFAPAHSPRAGAGRLACRLVPFRSQCARWRKNGSLAPVDRPAHVWQSWVSERRHPFRHARISPQFCGRSRALRAEFAASGFDVAYFTVFERMMRGGCVLINR